MTSHVMVTSDSCPLRGVVCPAWPTRATTARSCGWPSRRSSRWSPSRCSCSPTPPSSATSAPPRWPGSGIAAVVLQTVVGLCVFLAYGTTASVARRLGAGDRRGALAQGIDGVWLAVVIGVVATVARHRPHRAAGPGVRRRPERGRPGDDVPADRLPRDHAAAGHARRPPACCAACRTPARRWSSPSPATLLNIALNLLLVYGAGPVPGSASPARPGGRCWPRWPAPPPCSRSWSGRPGARARR